MKLRTIAIACALAACTPANEATTTTEDAALPEGARVAVIATMPGATIGDFEIQNEADGGELEVEVTTAEGVEYELDLMPNGADGWNVVQIQRDIAWADAPESVRAAAAAAPGAFEPVRVIESTDPGDGSVYYQLFSPTDVAQHPSVWVRWFEGEAAVMPPAH